MKKGNCVDKFIEKRLDISINEILQLRDHLSKKIDIRTNAVDYFNTGCYENDYADIRKIKEEALKLAENCNKFLVRISEQYSKLS